VATEAEIGKGTEIRTGRKWKKNVEDRKEKWGGGGVESQKIKRKKKSERIEIKKRRLKSLKIAKGGCKVIKVVSGQAPVEPAGLFRLKKKKKKLLLLPFPSRTSLSFFCPFFGAGGGVGKAVGKGIFFFFLAGRGLK